MRYLMVVGVVVAVAGCSTIGKIGDAQQNPVVVGGISVAAKGQCEQFARDQPAEARTTAQYLATLASATQACVDGIHAGLSPGP